MKKTVAALARIYFTEGEHRLSAIIELLHDDLGISGLTVTRGIVGFGEDGKLHSTSLIDLSLDLPLVLEFFDTPQRVESAVELLLARFDLDHVLVVPVTLCRREE